MFVTGPSLDPVLVLRLQQRAGGVREQSPWFHPLPGLLEELYLRLQVFVRLQVPAERWFPADSARARTGSIDQHDLAGSRWADFHLRAGP